MNLESILADIEGRKHELTECDIRILLRAAWLLCAIVDANNKRHAIQLVSDRVNGSHSTWLNSRWGEVLDEEENAWMEAEHVYETGVL